jgi:hypothetical protein
VRGEAYVRRPSLAETLPLWRAATAPPGNDAAAAIAWSCLTGGEVTLTASVADARALLLRTLAVAGGEQVTVPANASAALIDALKRWDARPVYAELDAELGIAAATRVTWANPVAGLPVAAGAAGSLCCLDCADTWPSGPLGGADALLCGLHLSDDPAQAGALLGFRDPELARRARLLAAQLPAPDDRLAAAQAARARALAERQRRRLNEVARGLREAAGLPLMSVRSAGALPHGIAVRVPEECDVSTFYAYMRGERTPVAWLPELRPLHRAAGVGRESAGRLARWLLIPVGPFDTAEDIRHAVLGVVKCAEYLGVRWRTDPARAVWYAGLMNELYGPEHDAYRPAFDI